MKFAHEFKEALQREGFPPHWVESAIPYSELKKCIKRVESELQNLGLDAKTLSHLTTPHPGSPVQDSVLGTRDGPVAFQYDFANEVTAFRPKLTLYIRLEDGLTVDATLSPETRKYLEGCVARDHGRLSSPFSEEIDRREPRDLSDQSSTIKVNANSGWSQRSRGGAIQRVEVPLTFDAEFFGLLQGELSTLDALQSGEQRLLTGEIQLLGNKVAKVSSPSKSSKTDLNRWRELFEIYLQAGIFFSTNELDHGSRTSDAALKQLQWWQSEVTKRGIAKTFKLSASREALERFTKINMVLLTNLKFQEINQLAISKILKKFDKRTSLGAKRTFPRVMHSELFMSHAMAKAVCFSVSNEIIKIVPQLDDYLCPVCFSISYKPVRLACGHVFCIRCMIQMQKTNSKHCPLCRDEVIMTADSGNLDMPLMKFLQKYFPKETKAKQRENEIAAGVDRFGEDFTGTTRCVIM